MSASTIFMMPDGKHLFVSAEGAGYIIDAQSRTLVEEIGSRPLGCPLKLATGEVRLGDAL